jgi:hypothetical protein
LACACGSVGVDGCFVALELGEGGGEEGVDVLVAVVELEALFVVLFV